MKWDKRVSYEWALNELLRAYRKARSSKRKCYIAVYITQLRNGSRISEAARFIEKVVAEGVVEAYVRLSKSRGDRERLMVFPEFLDLREVRTVCYGVRLDPRVLKVYIRSVLPGVNTHSLRYAYVNKLLRDGVNPAYVSMIVGHARLDTLRSYIQRHVSEDLLRSHK